MAITKHLDTAITDSDRIQLRNESNFSFHVLKELIDLRPVEVNAKIVNGEVKVSISMTEGLVATVLPKEEENAPYYADIDNQMYQRLNVDIDEAERTWFILFEENHGLPLEHIATQPIVIKSFSRTGKGHSLIFAASGAFRIVRCTDKRVQNVVSDPAAIPDALLRMVEVIDEPLPEKRASLEILKERVKTTKRMLELYQSRQYQLSVKEEIALSILELDDYVSKVDARIEDMRFQEDGVEAMLYLKMTQRLRQLLGTKKFENSLSTMYREVRAELIERDNIEKFLNGGNVYENVLSKLEDVGAHKDVLRILNAKTYTGFFANACGKCGGEAVVRKEGGKHSVKCKSCDNSLEEKLCSKSRITTIGNWNKANETTKLEAWLGFLAIDVEREEEIEFKMKKMLQTLMAMIKYWRETMPADVKVRVEFSIMQETLEMVKFVKMLYSEKKVQASVLSAV